MVATVETPTPPVQSETLLKQIMRTYYDILPAFERHMGLSRARWHMLLELYRADTVSQAVLQQRLSVDGAAVTRQVKQLEEEGLVVRRADPDDNRFTLVALTAAGRSLTASLMDRRAEFEAIATDGISQEDMLVIDRCLRRIRENVQALVKA